MKLSSNVANELEQKILDREFLADQPLPSEARLCESFGVSRTVIREALQQLKSCGIIHSITGSGNYVSRNNTDNLKRNLSLMARLNEGTDLYHEMLQLREVLEVDCIRLACRNSDKTLIKNLKRHLKSMQDHKTELDLFGQHDHAFHLEILKAANNSLFTAILESLYDNFLKVSRKVYDIPGSIERVLSEHKAIVEAIRAGDENSASQLLRQHIQKSKDGI